MDIGSNSHRFSTSAEAIESASTADPLDEDPIDFRIWKADSTWGTAPASDSDLSFVVAI